MNDFFALIKERVDLRDLVAEHTDLNSHGVGRCPFHTERTGSFKVYADGHYYCFGCGEGGDIFDLVEKLYNTSRAGALRILAGKAGIPLDGTRPSPEVNQEIQENRERRDRRDLFDLWRDTTWRGQATVYRVLTKLCRIPKPADCTEEEWTEIISPLYRMISRAERDLEIFEAGNLDDQFLLFQETTQDETYNSRY